MLSIMSYHQYNLSSIDFYSVLSNYFYECVVFLTRICLSWVFLSTRNFVYDNWTNHWNPLIIEGGVYDNSTNHWNPLIIEGGVVLIKYGYLFCIHWPYMYLISNSVEPYENKSLRNDCIKPKFWVSVNASLDFQLN